MEGSEWFVRYRETTDKRIATLEAKLLESQGQVGELTALVARLEATMRDFDDTLQRERGRRIEAHEEAQQAMKEVLERERASMERERALHREELHQRQNMIVYGGNLGYI